MSSSSAALSTPEGPGSVSGAPNLPAGFTDTFTSRYIDTGELRQHTGHRRRGAAGGADPVLGSVPRLTGRGARPQAACCRRSYSSGNAEAQEDPDVRHDR